MEALPVSHTPLCILTESGSLCCSRKAENSTRRSLVVPMDRPCQAGTEGAGADAGSNPEITIDTFTRVHAPASRPQWGRILNREGDTQAGAFAQ